MKRIANPQKIAKSKIKTSDLIKQYKKREKEAIKRMEALRKAGYQKSQFYRNWKNEFNGLDSKKRMDIAKELAKVNRFLNSKSSTPKGYKKVREDLIDVINNKMNQGYEFEEGEETPIWVDKKNLDKFLDFMDYYRSNYESQLGLGSDTVVEAFNDYERLNIRKKDLFENMEAYLENKHLINQLSLEDLFNTQNGEKVDRRRRFSIDDLIEAGLYKEEQRQRTKNRKRRR